MSETTLKHYFFIRKITMVCTVWLSRTNMESCFFKKCGTSFSVPNYEYVFSLRPFVNVNVQLNPYSNLVQW